MILTELLLIPTLSAMLLHTPARNAPSMKRYLVGVITAAPPLVHRRIQTIQLGGDLVGGLGPDEGRGIVVVLVDVAVDGRLQLDDRAEDAAPEPPPGQRGEEALDRVRPRARGRGEVEGPA